MDQAPIAFIASVLVMAITQQVFFSYLRRHGIGDTEADEASEPDGTDFPNPIRLFSEHAREVDRLRTQLLTHQPDTGAERRRIVAMAAMAVSALLCLYIVIYGR